MRCFLWCSEHQFFGLWWKNTRWSSHSHEAMAQRFIRPRGPHALWMFPLINNDQGMLSKVDQSYSLRWLISFPFFDRRRKFRLFWDSIWADKSWPSWWKTFGHFFQEFRNLLHKTMWLQSFYFLLRFLEKDRSTSWKLEITAVYDWCDHWYQSTVDILVENVVVLYR